MFPFFPFYPPSPLVPPLFNPPYPPTCGCSQCCQKTPAPLEAFFLDANETDFILLSMWSFYLAKDAPKDGYALEMDARAKGYKVFQDGHPCMQTGVEKAPGYYCFTGEAGDLTLELTPKEKGISIPVNFIKKKGEEHGEVPASYTDTFLVIKANETESSSFSFCTFDKITEAIGESEEYAVIINPTIYVEGETATGKKLTYGKRPQDSPFNILGRKAL